VQPSLAVEPPQAADLAPEPARPAAAPSGEKIDLEIPAFLRRQYSGTQH
jgi:hypothetical protein